PTGRKTSRHWARDDLSLPQPWLRRSSCGPRLAVRRSPWRRWCVTVTSLRRPTGASENTVSTRAFQRENVPDRSERSELVQLEADLRDDGRQATHELERRRPVWGAQTRSPCKPR